MRLPTRFDTMDSPPIIRRRIVLRGLVQGVGLRPFVCRVARDHALTGWVRNDAAGAVIEVQGPPPHVARFQSELGGGPASARIETVQIEDRPPVAERDFVIRPSATDAAGVTCPPTDLAPCADCLAEFRSPHDRRRGYPFITCTSCGPRFTILKAMPFDRDRTSMVAFPLCDRCRQEFEDPADRRFHAQAIACPECGPQVRWREGGAENGRGDESIHRAKQVLESGGVIAVKGVGGFHLTCDGTNADAVARVRGIKRRPARPLALMASCLEMIREYAEVGEAEAEWLVHPARPIVLLRPRQRVASTPLAPSVAPGVNRLGFMLPYTPLHLLLIGERPLVMTSGNHSGEPLVRDSAEATTLFGPLVDGVLDHDRGIEVRCDDSVLQVINAEPRMVRRSRGFVPEPLIVATDGPCVLAVGGEFKTAPALAVCDRIYPGPHVGDLQGWSGLQALEEAVTHLCHILGSTPAAVACDAHPGYLSHRWATDFARTRGIPCLPIHHHEAHAAAWQVDAGREQSPALVVVFDGTGAGPDGTLWGSEFFFLPGAGPAQPLASLNGVRLPGGELAVRNPARTALAHLHAAGLNDDDRWPGTQALTARERSVVRVQIERGIQSPLTRSMGRLFDAVASLLGVCQEATYEGQPAIELEALADPTDVLLPDFHVASASGSCRVDPAPLLSGMVLALGNGEAVPQLAYAFHIAVARMVVAVLRELRQTTGTSLVGFSGGVFQNRLLEELLAPLLRADGFEARFHQRLPCNDGGLAVGQALLARRALAGPS